MGNDIINVPCRWGQGGEGASRGERGQSKLYQAGARWGQREAGQSPPKGPAALGQPSHGPPVTPPHTAAAPDLVRDCRLGGAEVN